MGKMDKDVGATEVYVALRDFISHLRGTTEVYSKENGSEEGFSKKKKKGLEFTSMKEYESS